MCLIANAHGNEPASRRYRTLLVIGSLCLVLALTSQSLNLAFGLPLTPLHFLRGLLLGFSIAVNLGAVLVARRRRLFRSAR
jgi:hypothetical protein